MKQGDFYGGFGDMDDHHDEVACPEPYTNFSDKEQRQFREVMEQAE